MKHCIQSSSHNSQCTHNEPTEQSSATNHEPAVGRLAGSTFLRRRVVWMWFMNVNVATHGKNVSDNTERDDCIHVVVKLYLSPQHLTCGDKCTVSGWFQMNTISLSTFLQYLLYNQELLLNFILFFNLFLKIILLYVNQYLSSKPTV